jgi:hypothetical protein
MIGNPGPASGLQKDTGDIVPPKNRELEAELLRAGFVHDPKAGKGSSTMMRDPDDPANAVLFSGADGDDARPPFVKKVRAAIARRLSRKEQPQ